MKTITLTAHSQLHQNCWQPPQSDEAEGCYLAVDVTTQAEQFLFDELELGAGVTLKNVFELVMASPGLQSLLARHRAVEICKEGLASQAPHDSGIAAEDVEYVAVYRTLSKHSGNRTLSGWRASFHGVGPVLQEDVIEHGNTIYKAGARRLYSFSFTSPQVLRDLPLRLDADLAMCEEDFSIDKHWERTEHLVCEEFTLGDVLDAIFWELTFYGVGQERDQAAKELTELAQSALSAD